MPLAYAHIVQVLVDLILWMFPFMAFSIDMSPLLVVVGSGLLTISYQGLFDLAKQFLDPYDNESYGRGEDPLCVDTLIAETNAGSIRWLYGFEELPFSAQRLNDGELYDYLLPVRGYSVEELDQMEEEKIDRERQLEEQRKREDEETAAAAEAERVREEAEETEIDETTEKRDVDDDTIYFVNDENNAEIAVTEFTSPPILETASSTNPPTFDITTTVKSAAINGNKTVLEVEENPSSSIPETFQNISTSSNISKIYSSESDATPSVTSSSSTEETRPVHTVTTLATDGSLISSFKPTETIKSFREEPVPSGMQTSNYLVTLKKQNEEIKSLLAAANLDENNFASEMVDLEAYEDLPWFDEVGTDGQEFRLSQQLADESWVVETDDIEVKNMTREEYEDRLQEIEENAENELKETIEILSAIPGAETDENLYTVTERKKKVDPIYDQTRLDGISQLWGLPPEDPSALSEYEPPEKIDDVDFSSVSQLWGGEGSGLSDVSSTINNNRRPDESEIAGMGSFAGISELWGSTNDFQYDSDDRQIDTASSNETTVDEGGNWDKEDSDDEIGSFAGLPWHDEKEYRLSEMLADEEWAIEPADETTPMTLEDYNKQVEEIITQAEEELRETEAILLSKPGEDPVGWDYDDEQLTPMSNTSIIEDADEIEDEDDIGNENENEIKNKTLIEDADLAVLEMDVEIEGDPDNVDDDTNSDTNHVQAGGDEWAESTLLEEEDIAPTSNTTKTDSVEIPEDLSSKDDKEDDSKKDPESNSVVLSFEAESSSDDDTTKDSGKDKIQPIFLEGQEDNSVPEDADDEDDSIVDDIIN
jgi:hypothetical protein